MPKDESLPPVWVIALVVLWEAIAWGLIGAVVTLFANGMQLDGIALRVALGMFLVKAALHLPTAMPLIRRRLGLPEDSGKAG